MKTKRNYESSKQALILASVSLIAAAVMVPAITGENGSEAQGFGPEPQTEVIPQKGTDKTVMIIGHDETQFVPQLVRVNVGDSIVFINQDGHVDGSPHTVVSVDSEGVPTGKFDSGLLYVGDTFEVSFEKAGVYNYVDSIHPEITGIIAVI